MSKPDITLGTADSRSYIPDTTLIGSRWQHQGNGHIYTIGQFQWNGEDDTWMYGHYREGSGFMYLRTPANFHGLRENGEPRYVRIG